MESIRRENVQREFLHSTRGETAAASIGKITKGCDIFGLTKGDFSMIDILSHIVDQIGRCKIDISTWTAANSDIKKASDILNNDKIESIRWLVDRSFPNRQPEYFKNVLEKFGNNSVRIARSHAKFIVLENADFSVAVRTSMNLNMNKRIENFEISEGSEISKYLKDVVDYHFAAPMEDSYQVFKNYHAEPEKKIDDMDLGDFASLNNLIDTI